MGANCEYHLRLQEEEFLSLPFDEQTYLLHKGMEVRQKSTEKDDTDEHYKKLRSVRIKAWNEEQDYLYKKNNKMLGN